LALAETSDCTSARRLHDVRRSEGRRGQRVRRSLELSKPLRFGWIDHSDRVKRQSVGNDQRSVWEDRRSPDEAPI